MFNSFTDFTKPEPVDLICPKLSSQMDTKQCAAYVAAQSEDAIDIFAKFWTSARSDLSTILPPNALRLAENLTMLFINWKECQTMSGFLSSLVLFLNNHMETSAMTLVARAISMVFDQSIELVAGAFVYDSQFGAIDFTPFKAVLSNFKSVANSKIASQLMTILSMVVTAGLIKQTSLEFSWGGFELFKAQALRKQVHAGDFIEAIMDTIVLFGERAQRCFAGEGVSAFFADNSLIDYDQEYTLIVSKVPLLEVGKLSEIDMDEREFDRRLDSLTNLTAEYLRNCKAGERTYYSVRLEKLKSIRTKLILAQRKSVRHAPYGILLAGGSSVGKSSLAAALVRYVLQVNGKDASDESIITLNEFDKFQSEYRSRHSGVIFDDLANGKIETTEGNPLMKVIQFINNIPQAALNPNVELKGNVMIEPDVVLGTTNIKHLNAYFYSVEPLAIIRRFDPIITVTVKKEFQKNDSQMLDSKKIGVENLKEIPDVNLFDVQYACGEGNNIQYKFHTYKGQVLEQVTIATLLAFLRDESRAHFEAQRVFVEKQRSLSKFTLCEHSMLPSLCNECCKLDCQSGIDFQLTERLFAVESCVLSRYSHCASLLLHTRFGKLLSYGLARKTIKSDFLTIGVVYLLLCFSVLFASCPFLYKGWALMLISIGAILVAFLSIEKRRLDIVRDLSTLPNPSKLIRDVVDKVNGKMFIASIFGFGAVLMIYRLYKKWKSQMMAPITEFKTSEEGLANRQEFWTPPDRSDIQKIPVSPQCATGTFQQMELVVKKNIYKLSCVWKSDGKTRFNYVIPMKNDVLLIPSHSIPKDGGISTIYMRNNRIVRSSVNPQNTYRIPDTDLALWYCPEFGPSKDLTKYLPIAYPERDFFATMVHFVEDAPVTTTWFISSPGVLDTTQGGVFKGFKYSLDFPTYDGLCMAPILGEAPLPFIAGFHLAGKGNKGGCGRLTQADFDSALCALESRPHILTSHSRTNFDTVVMGVDVGPLRAPREDSVVLKMDQGPNMLVLGETNLPRGRFMSAVRTHLISKDVAEIMALPKIHGKPYQMEDPIHWEVDLDNKCHTAFAFEDEFLAKAVIDYDTSVQSYFRQHPEKLSEVGKISDDANLAGIDGVMYLNAINIKTSKGFPTGGSKASVIRRTERYVQGISDPLDMDPEYWAEVARMEDILKHGETVNTVFKGALKDEPTKIGKTKVRVFAGSNLAFTLLVRKYYLTLAKLMQTNPLVFECAVGVDVESPQWTTFMQHVRKFGEDRIIAGDYKSFDGRMSPKFMASAFKILINIARLSGNYDSEDLEIMKGIATEICNPLYDFNGILVQVFGSNPSGHPLTVIINSIVNSLYLRYCYYKLHSKKWFGGKLPLFREVVAALTYGDDNVMGVKHGFEWFNHTAIADELAECGITYTMADKEAKSVPFIRAGEASFLKHYAVWDDELKLFRAPIEEASIQKMLHCHLESDVLTDKEFAAEAITNAANAYFQFGKEVYATRVAQLAEVARRNGVPVRPEVFAPYEERIQNYKEKFSLE